MTSLKLRDLDALVITVTITRELRLRLRIGMWLMRLAAKVMGCGFEVKQELQS